MIHRFAPRPGLLGAALLAALAAVVPPAAAQAPFTLEQVLSAPFPTGLTASRGGGRAAWVFDEAGARNVWLNLNSLNLQVVDE